jgi:hypothetical protein
VRLPLVVPGDAADGSGFIVDQERGFDFGAVGGGEDDGVFGERGGGLAFVGAD